MSQVGWRDPASGEEKTFDAWLADAAEYGDALGFPYEVLFGMAQQAQGHDRPDGITATQLLGSARHVWLEANVPYFSDPQTNYAAFRGVIGHSMLEKYQNPDALVERRFFRRHNGIELSGQLDKLVVTGTPFNRIFARAWAEWCDAMYAWESAGELGDMPERPYIYPDTVFHIEDWKTKEEVPFGNYVYLHHQKQGNIYRFITRIPREFVLIRFVYVTMKNVKAMRLYDGGKYANGREKPNQVWTDEEMETFLDDRLSVLELQRRYGRPIPYDKEPSDDLWYCEHSPVHRECLALAAKEREAAWRKGESVDRVPPRSAAEETKASLPKKKKKAA